MRRKSATFAFRCDRDSVSPTAAISFVGADPDECAYLFVVRSQHACAGVQPSKPGSVGPGGVFAIIMIIAIIVYFAGGVFYQRNVTNARGWRQLPNYSFWAGIGNFFSVSSFWCVTSSARYWKSKIPNNVNYRTSSSSSHPHARDFYPAVGATVRSPYRQVEGEWEGAGKTRTG